MFNMKLKKIQRQRESEDDVKRKKEMQGKK